LAPDIPIRLSEVASPFVDSLLGSIARSDTHFALHPGGASIVRGLEAILGLDVEWQTTASWDVLRTHGNMSSATVLFVLERLVNEARKRGSWRAAHTAVMAFGPGLSVEGIRLKNCDI
jgi:predicted naringenin-chalcone synthase